ncbi:MAG: DUF3152 domain-containing protein [Bifidobacteriaceae bacterium]|jgi:hypothetical protein|nr:DUF3152 domain-containing protein [Bifidobacteriaceae bacterium]
MATYQTRRKTRLTLLEKTALAVILVVALVGLAVVVSNLAVSLGEWSNDSGGGDGGIEQVAPPEQAGTQALAAGPQAGNHPGAAVVVTYEVSSRGATEVPLAEFADAAQRIFDDPSGWRSAGVGFDRVAEGADFTLWLATPEQLTGFSSDCAPEYSCRVGRDVIINQERWLRGALPGALDGIEIGKYRTMAINHEVGHWLGHGHTACTTPGELAPLMMQQSKGLDGCLANPYPLPEEQRAPSLGIG